MNFFVRMCEEIVGEKDKTMTDQEHVAKITAVAIELNQTAGRARDAGLEVIFMAFENGETVFVEASRPYLKIGEKL